MPLHRSNPPLAFNRTPMSSVGFAKEQSVLSTSRRDGTQSAIDESNRRAPYRISLLWLATHHCRTEQTWLRGKRQADQAIDVCSGTASDCPISSHFQATSRTQKVSVLAQRTSHRTPVASSQFRYHLHKAAKRICLPCRSYRLVLPHDPGLEAFKLSRGSFLCRGLRRVFGMGNSRNIQHRSRGSVHIDRVCRCSSFQGHTAKHGREGSSSRQCLCGKVLEVFEI